MDNTKNIEKKGKLTVAQKVGFGLATMVGGLIGEAPKDIYAQSVTPTPAAAADSMLGQAQADKIYQAFRVEFIRVFDSKDYSGSDSEKNAIAEAIVKARIDSKDNSLLMARIDRYITARLANEDMLVANRTQYDTRTTESYNKILKDLNAAIDEVEQTTDLVSFSRKKTEAIRNANSAILEAQKKGDLSNSDSAYLEREISKLNIYAKSLLASRADLGPQWRTGQQLLDEQAARNQAERDRLDDEATARVLEVDTRIRGGNPTIISTFMREARRSETASPAVRDIRLKVAYQNAIRMAGNDRVTIQRITDLYNDEIAPFGQQFQQPIQQTSGSSAKPAEFDRLR